MGGFQSKKRIKVKMTPPPKKKHTHTHQISGGLCFNIYLSLSFLLFSALVSLFSLCFSLTSWSTLVSGLSWAMLKAEGRVWDLHFRQIPLKRSVLGGFGVLRPNGGAKRGGGFGAHIWVSYFSVRRVFGISRNDMF